MPLPSFSNTEPPSRRPTATELARERALIEEAEEEFRQGLALDADEFDAWLDALDGDEAVPPPSPRLPGTSGL